MTQPLIVLDALAVAFFSPPWCVRAQEQRRMTDAPQPRRAVEAVLRLERQTMDAIRAKDTKALALHYGVELPPPAPSQ